MEELYHYVVHHVFCALLRGDAEITAKIRAFGEPLALQGEDFWFTLPGLFEFATVHCEGARRDDNCARDAQYKAFRQLLYKNPTNTLLREQGGIVRVERVNKDHALSVYRLARI